MSTVSRRRRAPQSPPLTLHNINYRSYTRRNDLRRRQELLRQVATDAIAKTAVGDELLSWIARPENLWSAWEHLHRNGGQAPGPDGLTYNDLRGSNVWGLIRPLSDVLTSGCYVPGPSRRVKISKGSGRGHRTLEVQNLVDRVVARAIHQIIEPLIRPQLHSATLGYITGDRQVSLAWVERFACDHGLVYAVKNDIRDAFDQVPLTRLLQLLPQLVPSNSVIDLISRVIAQTGGRGIRQGSPLSSLLLDIYLDHLLQRRWLRTHPEWPLFRYADDLLALCPDRQGREQAADDLHRILGQCSMPAKYGVSESIETLQWPRQVGWLGYDIAVRDGRLSVLPGEEAWQQLQAHLMDAHHQPGPAFAANESILGWVGQIGPCYDYIDRPAAYRRVRSVAIEQAFDELPSYEDFHLVWSQGNSRWRRLRATTSAPIRQASPQPNGIQTYSTNQSTEGDHQCNER
jgi:retron-type reverse transcriptase